MKADEANALRLYANEVMHQLYEAGEREQLRILCLYAQRAIEVIDGNKSAREAARETANQPHCQI